MTGCFSLVLNVSFIEIHHSVIAHLFYSLTVKSFSQLCVFRIIRDQPCVLLLGEKMEKKAEISKPFYVSSAPKQKTSAEIISEARKSLRTLKTQRPLTPREDQRKLFGPSSSRTPENRPPSAFRLGPKPSHTNWKPNYI